MIRLRDDRIQVMTGACAAAFGSLARRRALDWLDELALQLAARGTGTIPDELAAELAAEPPVERRPNSVDVASDRLAARLLRLPQPWHPKYRWACVGLMTDTLAASIGPTRRGTGLVPAFERTIGVLRSWIDRPDEEHRRAVRPAFDALRALATEQSDSMGNAFGNAQTMFGTATGIEIHHQEPRIESGNAAVWVGHVAWHAAHTRAERWHLNLALAILLGTDLPEPPISDLSDRPMV